MSNHSVSNSSSPRRRWPWVLLALLAALLVADQLYRLVENSRVRQEIAAIQSESLPTNCDELARWHGSVPDGQNAALQIVQAANDVALPGDLFSRIAWGRNDELGPDDRDELSFAVTNNAAVFERLRFALQKKECRYPVDYTLGPATLLPHLAKVKSLAQLLKAEAVLDAEENRMDAAVRDVVDSVALGRTLESEPLLISQLVRVACLSISCSTVERLLTQYNLNADQLRQLFEAFSAASEASPAAFRTGFVGELSIGSYCFTRSPRELANVMGSNNDSVSNFGQVLFPLYSWTGLRDRDYLFYLRTMHELLDGLKTPFPQSLTRARETTEHLEQTFRSDRLLIFSRMLLPALQNANKKSAEAEARLRCTLTAIALERQRLKSRGAVPEQLAELVPSFLEAVPSDPFDGAPLRYHKLSPGPGYVVYSIGPDGKDDGGLERTANGNSAVRRWPPGKAPERSPRRTGALSQEYDVTFIVDR